MTDDQYLDAIDAAKKAMGENDIPAMMQAYTSTEEYSE